MHYQTGAIVIAVLAAVAASAAASQLTYMNQVENLSGGNRISNTFLLETFEELRKADARSLLSRTSRISWVSCHACQAPQKNDEKVDWIYGEGSRLLFNFTVPAANPRSLELNSMTIYATETDEIKIFGGSNESDPKYMTILPLELDNHGTFGNHIADYPVLQISSVDITITKPIPAEESDFDVFMVTLRDLQFKEARRAQGLEVYVLMCRDPQKNLAVLSVIPLDLGEDDNLCDGLFLEDDVSALDPMSTRFPQFKDFPEDFREDFRIASRFASDGISKIFRKVQDWATGVRTLRGHGAPIMHVAFSPNGKLLASASDDDSVKIWDSATGTLLRTLAAHSNTVQTVAFSPDGKYLASHSDDQTARLWDPTTGVELQTHSGYSSFISSIAFSPDGKLIASAFTDGTVKLWNPATGAVKRTLQGPSDGVREVRFSPNGQMVALACEDGTIIFWDSDSGLVLQTVTGYSTGVWTFSPDDKLIASASEDGPIRLWGPALAATSWTLYGHWDQVRVVVFSPDGKRVVSVSDDKTVRLWDPATGTALHTFKGHFSSTRVAFSPDGRLLASTGYHGEIWLRDPTTGTRLQTLKGHTSWIRGLAFSPDGSLVASGSVDSTIRLTPTSVNILPRSALYRVCMGLISTILLLWLLFFRHRNQCDHSTAMYEVARQGAGERDRKVARVCES